MTTTDRVKSLELQIKTLNTRVSKLSTYADAINNKMQRAGNTIDSPVLGSTDVTITWPKPWPDTAYGVWIELLTGTGALGNLHCTLKAGSKTTTGCVVTVSIVNLAPGAAVGVDVIGVRA